MATNKLSVLVRVQNAIAAVTAKQAKRNAAMLAQVQAACNGIQGLELVPSGKTTLITLNGVKVGVVNTSGIQACAQTSAGIGYVKVSANELAQYIQAIAAQSK